MQHLTWTWQRMLAEWWRQPLLAACVVAVLFACALWVVIGTIRGLANFRDVGHPDNATLLRIGETVRSGHIYPAIDRPPYLVTLYGPLTYVLRKHANYPLQCYQGVTGYPVRRAKWESFVSVIAGRRLLSTFPDVTIYAKTPEIPDPILNSVLELRAGGGRNRRGRIRPDRHPARRARWRDRLPGYSRMERRDVERPEARVHTRLCFRGHGSMAAQSWFQ